MTQNIGSEEMPAWLVEHGILAEVAPGVLALTEFGHNLTHVLVEIHDRIPVCQPIKGGPVRPLRSMRDDTA